MNISVQYLHHPDGSTTIVDPRVFSECVTFQLNLVRERAKELILEVAPDYKQRNAALGLLSEQETNEIKQKIQEIRTISNNLEIAIQAVVWDGNEQTRSQACDLVQSYSL
jgi:hypothetical protein